MSKYSFYYDESEHSRKINHKTITAENYFDSFIAVVVGWLSDNQAGLYERYAAFESKYQHRQSNGELKSTTIKQSQLKSGFASLNADNLSLLNEVKCYRIPRELSEWAMTLVGLANMGENVFPSKVVFSKTKDGYVADIL